MFFNPDSEHPKAGGKFNGLVKLKQAGFNVPDFFGWHMEDQDSSTLEDWLKRLPNSPVAVRSSALSEDGIEHSFAGQYESKLRVPNSKETVVHAALEINQDAQSDRVKRYMQHGAVEQPKSSSIPLVIQSMIEPAWSGVLFTVDPVSGLRDRMVLSFVAGDAEALVGGEVNGASIQLPRWGMENGGEPLDSTDVPEGLKPHLDALFKGGLGAENRLNMPADLEWAIDSNGVLYWLQMRPITTVQGLNPNELDSYLSNKALTQQVFTLGNIGEMMPGAVTPLTAEVFGGSIDAGLIDFASRSGVPKLNPNSERRYVQTFYYRLFFNLSNLYDFCRYTALNHKENIELSIVGRALESNSIPLSTSKARSVLNFFGQVNYLLSSSRRLKRLEALCQLPETDWSDDGFVLLTQLNDARKIMDEGFCHHFATSSSSGSNYTALVKTISAQYKLDRQSAQGLANSWLTGIGSVESADPLVRLQDLARNITSQLGSQVKSTMEPDTFLNWIQTEAPESIRSEWILFLQRHGHRGIREAELATPTWAQKPEQLAELLLQLIGIPETAPSSPSKSNSPENKPQPKSFLLRYFLKKARSSVAQREKSKALSIFLLSRLKSGYKKWGQWAVKNGIIHEAEDVFYLLTEELREATQSKGSLIEVVQRRKASYQICSQLHFKDLTIGKPFPIQPIRSTATDKDVWFGVPVSPGIARGKVRIVASQKDAQELSAEDILVAGFTDIGWTPYYGIVKGLITEMGSPLSHGAVVAREYGLPAVVGISGICSQLNEGDWIELNGLEGTVKRLSNSDGLPYL